MLKAAAYARVSTDKEDQINSLTNQRKYFEEYIKSHEDWEYAGVYYDEGVTGTQTGKRIGFNRMIENCMRGKIDLILTKEVSRFARNTVDTLKYTRMLREYGIGVVFINDNIDTRENDGEFRLSIMASVAQEESRKTSERVKWGQRRAMENGVVFGNNSILGYDVKDGKLIVNNEEAEIVRLIFHKYINEGKGCHVIARELGEAGIKPPRSVKELWSSAAILRILKNEKYAGDLMQKKYVTEDYLTHKKKLNSGDKIFIPNHHEPLIDRSTWERTQKELERRSVGAAVKKKYSNRYWCSGKIICSECGASFVIRKSRKKSGTYIAWACRTQTEYGKEKGCAMRMINNKSLLECMRYVTERTNMDSENIAEEIIAQINALTETGDDTELMKHRIREAEEKKLKMMDSYFAGRIDEREFESLKERYDEEIRRLDIQLTRFEKQLETPSLSKAEVEKYMYSEDVYGEIVDRIIVNKDDIIIKLKYVDFAFRIKYSTHGYKENYTTIIEECENINWRG